MKPCIRCGKVKPIHEFYAHQMMADGHLNKCKSCTREDTAKRDARLKSRPETAAMEADRQRRKTRRYAARKPDVVHAHKEVKLAIASGRIRRQPCEVCGNPKSDAHHEDYAKPLEVIWLCRKHHAARHVYLRTMAALRSSNV